MVTVIAISGSLRKGSYNTALMRSAAQLMPEGARLQVESIRDIGLYDGDVETEQGIPAPVAALKDAIASADGLLLVTPEYNNSVPGVLKNVIDWLSRPPADIARVFGGRPVALMGATTGMFGTTLAQSAWLPVLRTLGAQLWTGGKMMVPGAQGLFSADGTLTDEKQRERVKAFMEGFVGFVRARS
jgi:NAD(P)H-dependent FMN reductase